MKIKQIKYKMQNSGIMKIKMIYKSIKMKQIV